MGKQFIIASNKFPNCSYRYHKDRKDMWDPMLFRMEIVTLDQGFDGVTIFPYSPVELAAALTQMINRDPEQDVSQKMSKELDLSDLLDELSD